MLMGEEDTRHQGLLQSAPHILACLAKALADKALTRQDAANALAQASLQPFLVHLTGQQLAWLQRHMQLTAELRAQVTHMQLTAESHARVVHMHLTAESRAQVFHMHLTAELHAQVMHILMEIACRNPLTVLRTTEVNGVNGNGVGLDLSSTHTHLPDLAICVLCCSCHRDF